MKDNTIAALGIIIIFICGFGIGIGIYDFAYVRHLRHTIEQTKMAVQKANEKIKDYEKIIEIDAKEIERLANENITKMDPADVVSRYLNDESKNSLLSGTDQYTRRIIETVFDWLRRTIESDSPDS